MLARGLPRSSIAAPANAGRMPCAHVRVQMMSDGNGLCLQSLTRRSEDHLQVDQYGRHILDVSVPSLLLFTRITHVQVTHNHFFVSQHTLLYLHSRSSRAGTNPAQLTQITKVSPEPALDISQWSLLGPCI